VKQLLINIIIFIGLSISSSLAKNNEISIAADNWCPYNCIPYSSHPGYMVEVVIESFKLFGKGEKINYITMPWSRSMTEARAGNIAGIIGAIDSESIGLHMPKQEQGLMSAQFFTHSSSKWNYTTMKEIISSKKRIAAVKGYDFDTHIVEFIKKFPDRIVYSHGSNALPKLIRILQHNRVDALIEDQAVFWYTVKSLKLNSKKFRSAGNTGKPKKLYVSFYKKAHAEIVSKGIAALRKSGQLAKILKKYNLKDWK
jgi:polar amino acid transport system substrate-binding protein